MHPTASISEAKFFLLAEKKQKISKRLLDDLRSLTLAYGDKTNDEQLLLADVIMLHVVDEQGGGEAIKEIRSRPDLFLKPLVVFADKPLEKENQMVDDEIILPFSQPTLHARLKKLLSITQKIKELSSPPEGVKQNKLVEILLLRFLYARTGYSLNPFRNLASSFGYCYPLVQLLMDVGPGKEVALLHELEEAMLLQGKLVDKINLCPSCQHYHINFREVCPQCKALSINEEATIHHYRCAYVGRAKEFRHGFVLQCPKCGKELRHIGVDYDKPSEDFWCDECTANFPEPALLCFCLNCSNTFAPEHALTKKIKMFSLTQEGHRAARDGILPGFSLSDILRKEIGFYKFEFFKEFFRLEVLRCKRYQHDSTLLRLGIKNFKGIIAEEGINHAHKIRKELNVLFKSIFRETDILTDINDNESLILLINANSECHKRAVERIREKISAVFKRRIDVTYTMVNLRDEAEKLENILVKQQ